MLRLTLFLFFTLSTLTGCGMAVYQPARDAGFELDPAYEINDEDVLKAFSARPQLPDEIHVSYFSFDPKRTDMTATIEASPRVRGSYAIPSLMVTGERRFDQPARHRYGQEAKPPSIKKLRLLAARAKSDVLVVFDYGYRQRQVPNGWVATSVLLLPVLFVPMFDYEVESYLDAYVIDVKNGYLYAHISSSLEDEADTELIYSGAGDELTEEQWARLEGATRDKIARLFADPQLQRPVALVTDASTSSQDDG
ncbi:MAG: hypothetical protein RIF41_14745 [Polyangiaceae bacterium]